MNSLAVAAQMVTRLTGVILVILGLLFWTGNATHLVPIHIWTGFLLVVSFWVLALVAGRSGVRPGVVVLAVLWGLFVVYLGLTHSQILPGPSHWVIEVLHLLVGLATVGMAERLGGQIRQTHSRRVQA